MPEEHQRCQTRRGNAVPIGYSCRPVRSSPRTVRRYLMVNGHSLLRSMRTALVLFGVGFVLAGCGAEPAAVTTAEVPSKAISVVTVESRAIEGGLIASGSLIPREDTAVFSDSMGTASRSARRGRRLGEGRRGAGAARRRVAARSQVEQHTALAVQLGVQAERAEAEAARVNDPDEASVFPRNRSTRAGLPQRPRVRSRCAGSGRRDLAHPRRANDDSRAVCRPRHRTQRRVGDMGGGGTPWFRIAKDGQIELSADVSENALSRLTVGAREGRAGRWDRSRRHSAIDQSTRRCEHETRQGAHRTARLRID